MKHLIVCVTLGMLLVSCGKDDSGNNSSQTESKVIAKPAASSSPTPTSQPFNETLYLETLTDLGSCDSSSLHKLVYVEEDSQFHSCAKSGWMIVTIKGKDGSNGKDGVNGSNGKDGTVANSINQFWTDPITNRMWFFGGAVSESWSGSTVVFPSCPAGYNMPALADAQEAWSHGIATALNSLQMAQSLRVSVAASYTYGAYYNGGTSMNSIASVAALYNLACYK